MHNEIFSLSLGCEESNVKYFIQASVVMMVVSAFLVACSETASTGNLVCQLSAKEKQTCSSVLSLESGVLRLNENKHRFVLEANYDACFQSETVKMTGDYQQQPHQSVFDMELLARHIEFKNNTVERFSRTIGLVTLNNTSLKGRFVDIWAVIRTHTQVVENLPNIEVSCRKEGINK